MVSESPDSNGIDGVPEGNRVLHGDVNDGRYAPCSDARWCEHGDLTIVLSLRTGLYTSLTGLAAAVWSQICSGMPVRAAAEMSDADVADTNDAFRTSDLIHHFESLALIRRIDERAPLMEVPEHERPTDVFGVAAAGQNEAIRARVPSVISCCVGLALLRLTLRLFGLWRVLRLVRRIGGDQRAGALDGAYLRTLLRRTRIARAISPVPTACLEQALFVLCVLRRLGARPRLRIGVHPYPFSAHAWIEHDGEPVVESREELLRFRPFQPIDPALL